MDTAHVTPETKAQRRGWFGRNWWWFVPLLLIAVAAGGAGYAVAPLVELKTSEPYRMAAQEVLKSPEVAERLGKPLRDPTWLPAGSVYSDGARGDATLNFDVAGPNGRAHVKAQARKIAGQWGLNLLEVTFNDGKRIALDSGDAEGAEAPPFVAAASGFGVEAPKWQPGGAAPQWPPAANQPGVNPPAANQPPAANGPPAAPTWNPPKLPDMDMK